jgi:hypothetical protein
LRHGKPDFRLYGQLSIAELDSVLRLTAALPEDAVSVSGLSLDIDYAGFFVDVEEFLDLAATLMREGDSGHLDVFDDENRVLTRYELAPGGHSFKSHRYDDILEHTKSEGNW